MQNSGINFPSGEWGWKIQFFNPRLGFVSLENDSAAAILKTIDGGQTWKRIEVTDPQEIVESRRHWLYRRGGRLGRRMG